MVLLPLVHVVQVLQVVVMYVMLHDVKDHHHHQVVEEVHESKEDDQLQQFSGTDRNRHVMTVKDVHVPYQGMLLHEHLV
jgi:hypothetical protein